MKDENAQSPGSYSCVRAADRDAIAGLHKTIGTAIPSVVGIARYCTTLRQKSRLHSRSHCLGSAARAGSSHDMGSTCRGACCHGALTGKYLMSFPSVGNGVVQHSPSECGWWHCCTKHACSICRQYLNNDLIGQYSRDKNCSGVYRYPRPECQTKTGTHRLKTMPRKVHASRKERECLHSFQFKSSESQDQAKRLILNVRGLAE